MAKPNESGIEYRLAQSIFTHLAGPFPDPDMYLMLNGCSITLVTPSGNRIEVTVDRTGGDK